MDENIKNEAVETEEIEETRDTLPTDASDEEQLATGKELALKIAHILDQRIRFS